MLLPFIGSSSSHFKPSTWLHLSLSLSNLMDDGLFVGGAPINERNSGLLSVEKAKGWKLVKNSLIHIRTIQFLKDYKKVNSYN